MADRIEALERLARAFRTLPEKTLSRTVIEPAMKKALNPLLTELKGYIGTTYTKQSKGNLKKAATLRTVVKHGVTYGYVYFKYKPIGTQKNGRKKKVSGHKGRSGRVLRRVLKNPCWRDKQLPRRRVKHLARRRRKWLNTNPRTRC